MRTWIRSIALLAAVVSAPTLVSTGYEARHSDTRAADDDHRGHPASPDAPATTTAATPQADHVCGEASAPAKAAPGRHQQGP